MPSRLTRSLSATPNDAHAREPPRSAVSIGTKLGKTRNEGDTVPLSVTLENKLKKGHGMAVR